MDVCFNRKLEGFRIRERSERESCCALPTADDNVSRQQAGRPATHVDGLTTKVELQTDCRPSERHLAYTLLPRCVNQAHIAYRDGDECEQGGWPCCLAQRLLIGMHN